MFQFPYYGTPQQVAEMGQQMRAASDVMSYRGYPINVTVPAGQAINASIEVDQGGPFTLIGMSSKFEYVAGLPTIDIQIKNQSKGGYEFWRDPVPLDLVSNVGENGNQPFLPYFPIDDTMDGGSRLDITLRNNDGLNAIDVSIVLLGYSFTKALNVLNQE